MNYSCNKKTLILESRITKGNREFYKSKVKDIDSEYLLPMLNGLIESTFLNPEYEIHLVPMELCKTGLSLVFVFDRRCIDSLSYSYKSLINVIGYPEHIVEVRLNTYAMMWTRNLITWF